MAKLTTGCDFCAVIRDRENRARSRSPCWASDHAFSRADARRGHLFSDATASRRDRLARLVPALDATGSLHVFWPFNASTGGSFRTSHRYLGVARHPRVLRSLIADFVVMAAPAAASADDRLSSTSLRTRPYTGSGWPTAGRPTTRKGSRRSNSSAMRRRRATLRCGRGPRRPLDGRPGGGDRDAACARQWGSVRRVLVPPRWRQQFGRRSPPSPRAAMAAANRRPPSCTTTRR